MLCINIPAVEFYNDQKEEFVVIKATTLQLEHSLLSISKWESKWEKPFLSKTPKTKEETIDYIRCMTTNGNVPPVVYEYLSDENIKTISDYIGSNMTATTFRKDQIRGSNKEVITSELIYYWMIAQQIPFECQKWHLNRLLTLIRVCSIKNQPPKKMGKQSLMARNAKLNAQRRAQLNSKG